MAINSRKISSFPLRSELSGDEYLMVAYNHKSYKVPTSLLISNIISSITQKRSTVDGADNPITIKLNDGTASTFHVYNGTKGAKGDKGETGDKGPRGDSGVAIYSQLDSDSIQSMIVNDLENSGYTDKELTELILSAAAGITLNEKLDALEEKYLNTQTEYDNLAAQSKIEDDVKYLIFEE